MKPGSNLIRACIVWLFFSVLMNGFSAFSGWLTLEEVAWLWWAGLLCIVGLVVYDYQQRPSRKNIIIERDIPAGISVGTDSTVTYLVKNASTKKLRFRFTELTDDTVHVHGFPMDVELLPEQSVTVEVVIRPIFRGEITFGGVDVLMETPLNILNFRYTYPLIHKAKIFPNFSAISHFELLAHGQQVGQLGIHLNQRRGEGLSFRQLREFRPGDALRQVDWKATSRALKPISREFQDEQDQDIIFLLDNGRRMRAKDGELSHFDHCLNAFLLTSYVALRQGDSVGFLTFGSANRWLAPLKGKNNLNTLLHQVYDLHSSTATSDYLTAAQDVLTRHRKRSLVIIISNVHEQDTSDLLSAYRLLKRNHLVIFACLRETTINTVLQTRVNDFESALNYSSAKKYSVERTVLLRKLKASGAIVLDDEPSKLHVALMNEYYALKRSGRI